PPSERVSSVSSCEPPRRRGRLSSAPAGTQHHVLSVQRLSARARLDDSPEALARARAEAAAGDESWEQWVAEYERGRALTIQLELTVEFAEPDRPPMTLSVGGFIVETDSHMPKVEQQIAELAASEFGALGKNLAGDLKRLDIEELALMYVHVE